MQMPFIFFSKLSAFRSPVLNDLITFRHGNKGGVEVFVESGDVFYNDIFALVDDHSAKNGVFKIESDVAVGGGIFFIAAIFAGKSFAAGGSKNDVCGGNFERNGFIFRWIYGEHF